MSLKAFHVFFVSVATLACAAFGMWALTQRSASDDATLLIVGTASLLLAGALLIYGFWFLRKTRDMGYL